MKSSTATLVPVTDVAPLPLAVRQRISALVRQGATITEVVEVSPGTFDILYTGGIDYQTVVTS